MQILFLGTFLSNNFVLYRYLSLQISCLMGGKKCYLCLWGGRNFSPEIMWFTWSSVKEIELGFVCRMRKSMLETWCEVLGTVTSATLSQCFLQPHFFYHKCLQLLPLCLSPFICNCDPPFWNKLFWEGSTLIKNTIFSLSSTDNVLKTA